MDRVCSAPINLRPSSPTYWRASARNHWFVAATRRAPPQARVSSAAMDMSRPTRKERSKGFEAHRHCPMIGGGGLKGKGGIRRKEEEEEEQSRVPTHGGRGSRCTSSPDRPRPGEVAKGLRRARCFFRNEMFSLAGGRRLRRGGCAPPPENPV